MIRQPSQADLAQLIALWQEAFGDSEEEAAYYFAKRHRHENMLVYEADNKVVAMLSMLPLQLWAGQQHLQARYVFAVATALSHRGRGLSTALLSEAHRRMREEGTAASVLVPAEPHLVAFYTKRAYEPAFRIDQITLSGDDLDEIVPEGQVAPCEPQDYVRLRDAQYAGSALYARWDETALAFMKQSAEMGGGAMLALNLNGQQAAALIEPREGYLRVSELICPEDSWPQAMALIHSQMRASQYQLRLQEGSLGQSRPFGMIHWLIERPPAVGSPPYLAFAKD